MSSKLDFSKLELLTEEELNEEKGKWTLDDWIAYYTKDGVMTLDELHQYTLGLAYKIYEKLKNSCQDFITRLSIF